MTTPTPRCNAVAKQIGAIAARWKNRDIGAQLFSDLCEQQLDHLRQLETELAETRAERDALKNPRWAYNNLVAFRDFVMDRVRMATSRKAEQLIRDLEAQQADLARLRAVADELAAALDRAKIGHQVCEDSWYSCPKSDEGCLNDNAGTVCNCGADKHNARIDESLARYRAATNPAAVAANTGEAV